MAGHTLPSVRARLACALALLAAGLVPVAGTAQVPDEEASLQYRTPPPAMAALVDQPRTPAVSVSPTGDRMLLMEVPELLTIEDLAQPELRLAGLRINPRTHGPSRSRYFTDLALQRVGDGSRRDIGGLPEAPRIRNVRWAPGDDRVAFTLDREDGIELWVVEARDAAARRLVGPRLGDVYGSPYRWHPSGDALLARLVPAELPEPPDAPGVPDGPVVQETAGREAPARTYQDLLEDPHDEALLEHYLAAEGGAGRP